MEEIIQKIKEVKTMPELDALRIETVKVMQVNVPNYRIIQKEFIKSKNRLLRIPLLKRTW